MKNRILIALAALALFVTGVQAQLPSYVYSTQAGVSFITNQPATATNVSRPVKLPTFSGFGTLNITESGITGSPSGCTVALAYQGNNAQTAGSAVASVAFTPATGVQQFTVQPSVPSGDQYVATYNCSSTYPTAGSLTISFSPITAVSGDPCAVSPKSSVSVAISTATTTQVVAVSTGKAIYACGFTASFGATTTAQFEYGTSTNCTGTHALSGVFAPGTGTVLGLSGEGTRFSAPASNGLCIVSTGTGGINGVLSYVQQ